MPNFKNNRGFNMKNKGNFDFGNKGIYDIKTETKDQSVVEADKSTEKKSIFKKYGKSPMKNDKEKKYAANKTFNDHAKSTGLIPNFKTREEKINFYSNKSNVNKLNKAQKLFEANN